jgi:hypothetical protein
MIVGLFLKVLMLFCTAVIVSSKTVCPACLEGACCGCFSWCAQVLQDQGRSAKGCDRPFGTTVHVKFR